MNSDCHKTIVKNASHIASLSSLRLLIILLIVVFHLWPKLLVGLEDVEISYISGFAMSFCFIYSGFFTARRNQFNKDYSWKDHVKFMHNKLVRLYPMYIVALLMCIFVFRGSFSIKYVLFSTLMLDPFVLSHYYSYNAVEWFLCAIMFIYLISPIVVRFFNGLSILRQIIIIVFLILMQLLGGYFGVFNSYILFVFPPMRVVDFSVGVVLFNITQTRFFINHQVRLTPLRANVVELCMLIALFPLCATGAHYHYPHWFRALPMNVVPACLLIGSLFFTSKLPGIVSQVLSAKPLLWLAQYSSEIYIFQLATYFSLSPLLVYLGINKESVFFFIIHWVALIVFACVFHNKVTRRLVSRFSI